MLSKLSGKRAIVTGGASGIGRAIVRLLALEGVQAAVADVDLDRAKAVAGEVSHLAQAFQIDVRNRASVEACFQQIEQDFGGYDILCANAGVSTMAPVERLTDEDWDFNLDVNARGVFLTNQIAIRHFLGTGRQGVIVNTASLAGKVGAPYLAHYSASKFAVVGFTQALAREVAERGIRVNCVCPGFVRTSMQEREIAWEAGLRGITPEAVIADYVAQTPLGRLEEPEDVARTVLFLACDLSAFITGEAINVTGGVRMD
ncbi:MAG TPA: SDR family NAD(P)-dependent oxidoreductase [Aestuariivirgaceae bacterium]|jgi:NAD(P)-dependent dehydrogenase (short-subunit alcohol dehydrogenase family)|nr:SDR family NAD(P)-dependent oxidoreductase [Aestuariivirgaceae bacterium]